MSEKVLGILRAKRLVFSIPPYVKEFLLFTRDRVIVVRQSAKLPFYVSGATRADVGEVLAELSKTVKVEDILRSDKHNFAIRNSEITKVELKERRWSVRAWSWIDLSIITSEKKYQWNPLGIPKKGDVEFEDYENMLRSVFGDRLSARWEIIPGGS